MLNHMLVCVYPGIRNFPHSALEVRLIFSNLFFEQFIWKILSSRQLSSSLLRHRCFSLKRSNNDYFCFLKLIIVYRYMYYYM